MDERIPWSSRLGTKILVPAIVLFLGFATVVIVGFTHLHTESVERRIAHDLRNYSLLMTTHLREKEEEIAIHARFLADMVYLSESLGSASAGRSVLIYLVEYLQSEGVETHLYRGVPPAGAAHETLRRKGLLGIRATALIREETASGPVLRMAGAAPVERDAGITEVVVVTYELGRSFLEQLKSRIGSDISLAREGEIVASTLSEPGCLASLPMLPQDPSKRLDSPADAAPVSIVDCEGGPHSVIVRPLMVGFKRAGTYALSVPLESLLADRYRIQRNTLLTAAAVLAVVIPLYWLLLRRITRPLRDLSTAARRVAAGDLGEGLEARTTDEIGVFTRSFNAMVGELRESRRQLEEHHQQAMERADRLATIGELASGMAHEIRNPLAGISGAMEIIQSDRQMAEGREEVFAEVMKQIRRLNNLTNDLLSYSRPADPRPEPCNLNDVLDSAIFLLEVARENPNVKIVKSYDADLPEVNVDPRQIQQVFLNILLNAAQAMPDGGQVDLTTSVSTEGSDRAVIVEIEDRGVGMSPECLRKAVTPFFTTKHKGTGLGLSIVQRIVDSHDGTMDIRSVAGEGTKFTLSFRV